MLLRNSRTIIIIIKIITSPDWSPDPLYLKEIIIEALIKINSFFFFLIFSCFSISRGVFFATNTIWRWWWKKKMKMRKEMKKKKNNCIVKKKILHLTLNINEFDDIWRQVPDTNRHNHSTKIVKRQVQVMFDVLWIT